jgi:hypothetical protein
MSMRHRLSFVLPAIVSIAASSCVTGQSSADESLVGHAQQLQYIAVAVQGYVDFGNPEASLSGEELIAEATKENPELVEPLRDYYVTARRVGSFSSVMMCDIDKTKALVEDAGCTSSRIDALLGGSSNRSCVFWLDLQALCRGR